MQSYRMSASGSRVAKASTVWMVLMAILLMLVALTAGAEYSRDPAPMKERERGTARAPGIRNARL